MKPPNRPVPPRRPVTPPAGNVPAPRAIQAGYRKKEQMQQFRSVLMVIIALGGLWLLVQKFGLVQKFVPGMASAQSTPAKKKAQDSSGPDLGTHDSDVGYSDLFKNQPPASSGTTGGSPGTMAANGTSGGATAGDATGTGSQGTVGEVSGVSNDDIFGDTTLVLAGLDATRESFLKKDADLLQRAINEGAWTSYRKMLGRSLEAAIPTMHIGDGRGRYEEFWKTPMFYQAFLRWQVLGRFSPKSIHEVTHDERARAMITWLFNTPEKMEQVLLTVKPEDDKDRVMVFLKDAWTAKEAVAKKYFNLALACAVVFDKPMTAKNPGGEKDYSSELSIDPLVRYLWYIEKDEKGKMVGPIDRLPARDLVYVVCAPVIQSELEWAVDKMHLNRKNWGDAYGMVKYLMERAVKGINPYTEYTFAQILKEGGICGDQSYFCANTARANGIPAMVFAGETDLGGHAWVALKVKDDEWTTGVGRIGGVSKGQTDNPQIGGAITEQEVWQWNDRDHQSPVISISVYRHLWLCDYFSEQGKKDLVAEAVRLSNTIGRSFVESWARLYAVLEDETGAKDPKDPEVYGEWKKFAGDMRREFRENPRMAALAAKAETEHVFPYGSENDAKTAFLRERRRDERNQSEQKDLIAESLKREAEIILKRNEPTAKKDIEHLYDPALREYGGSITGFKMISSDYFGYMKDDPEMAKKAVRDIELAFNRVVKSNSGDWFRTKTEAGIVTTIAGYYRQVGDEPRAKMLEKRYEREMAKAERDAL
ncbi:transglutaminase domain-containing protein [Luteolibacter ambystomatis]|uniref:Transglutaminase domain-containing protein n=1 Tax=Luteolibacter ambystomatis TaxID=2824561 RepID=A0A975IYM5_9BACT|nr:transglutaminase domain-containing protein [Luteolibacter ambystomatis]QUE50387.1 transglutaminase domain-containing protein [Luteolibacter ambystomatis]